MSEDLPRPIYGTDISVPASEAVQNVRNQLTHARGQLSDIACFLGWKDYLKDAEGLLTCGLIALSWVRDKMLEAEAQGSDRTRCEVCGWPLAESADKGCVAGNCSSRPERGTPEWWERRYRRAVLAARAARAAKETAK